MSGPGFRKTSGLIQAAFSPATQYQVREIVNGRLHE